METRRWTNPTQPQTLQIAVFLLYINAVFGVLIFGALGSSSASPSVAGGGAGGFGIANERRWGYNLGLAMARAPCPAPDRDQSASTDVFGGDIINLMFEIALVALLLHPQSRDVPEDLVQLASAPSRHRNSGITFSANSCSVWVVG